MVKKCCGKKIHQAEIADWRLQLYVEVIAPVKRALSWVAGA